MSRSSRRRGQAEPLAALAAVFAVCAGLTLYAGVLDATLPGERRTDVAEPTLTRVHDEASALGVVEPDRLSTARAPAGYELNATLAVRSERWSAGPAPPVRSQSACRQTGVRTEPATVAPGRLCVEVWS